MEENQEKKSLFMNKLPANRWKTATIIVSVLAVMIIGILSYELYAAKSTATDMQQQNGQMMPGSSNGSSSDGSGQMTPPDANSGASQEEGSTDDSTSSGESSTDGLSTNGDESL